MKKSLSAVFVSILSLSLLLSACGGSAPTPVTIGQLPVFPGAKESTKPSAVAAVATFTSTLAGHNAIKDADGKAYDVPAGTKWDSVKSFYTAELGKGGWTKEPDGDANEQIYSRGTQVVVILFREGTGIMAILSNAK